MTCVVGPAAAEILIDTEYSDYFAKVVTVTRPEDSWNSLPPNGIIMSTPLSVPEFESMFAQMPSSKVTNYGSIPSSGQANVNWHKSNHKGIVGDFYMSGTYGYFKYTAGGANYLQVWAEFDDPAITLTGPTYLKCVLQEGESIVWPTVQLSMGSENDPGASVYNALVTDTSGIKATFGNSRTASYSTVNSLAGSGVKTYPVISGTWKNGLRVEALAGAVPRAQIDITKDYDGCQGISDHYVEFGETVYSAVAGTSNVQYIIPESEYPFSVSIYNAQNDKWYNSTYGEASPGEDPIAPVTAYVQNSQTGALLANAHLSILAAAGDPPELYEVVNATLPSGTGTYTLQPTGPTNPNPRYYKAVATVPGFSQIIENHSFTLNGPHDVIIEMRPDSGGPADPERAYLEFYVRDFAANPIPSASVQCGGRILQTNSAGYAVFEVAKNASHPWIAKKSGYVTIEGTATTGPNPRYVVNVVLGPGTVPTHTPTLGPGETPGGPGATPTPDRRTNEEKGQAVIDMIADNAEGIGALALICLLLGLLKLMVKW
jgi:hypothetical protein